MQKIISAFYKKLDKYGGTKKICVNKKLKYKKKYTIIYL